VIIPLQTNGSKPALFLIHGSDGRIANLRGLAGHLNADRPVYGIAKSADREGRAMIHIEDIAANYIREIEEQGIEGPYNFFGYSFGGLVAFEMAQQLDRSRREVPFLGMLDTWLPTQLAPAPEPGRLIMRRRLDKWRWHLRSLLYGPKRARWFRETVVSTALRRVYDLIARTNADIPVWLRSSSDVNIYAASRYRPRRYHRPIVLFRASDVEDRDESDEELGWGGVSLAGVEVHKVPGNHREVALSSAPLLAQMISAYLP
jgi:thioesterase domain-containing protein